MINTIKLTENLEIPQIITGLWQIADMERDGTSLDPVVGAQHMTPYLNAGLTAFDMADHYGSSEIIAGYFKNNFDLDKKVKLFTKWVPQPGRIDKDQVRKAVDTALERMQQSSIDLMQFHAWNYADPSWLDGLIYLNELREEGLIHHLGVTNFDAPHLRIACASGIPIITNQICHSVLDRRATTQMKEVCRAYGVKLLAFGTLAGGFLSEKWIGKPEPAQEELKTWSQMKYKRFIDAAGGWVLFQKLLSTLNRVAKRQNASLANIATRLVLENEDVAAVIVGARLSESDHITDNINMLNISLTDEDIQDIKVAQDLLCPIPGNCGDEYRKPPFLTASGDLSHHLSTFPKPFEITKGPGETLQIFSGTEWEQYAGYCRAVKAGNKIHISGTTATHGKLMVGGSDPAAQTHFIIDKIEAVLQTFDAGLDNVVRTRIFVHNLNDWEPVARAHGERFNGINPANTLVSAQLVGDGYLVEIEAEAFV